MTIRWKTRIAVAAWAAAASVACAQPSAVVLLPPEGRTVEVAAPEIRTPAIDSVDKYISLVLISDPRLRIGQEEINQAVADAVTASLRPNPTLWTDAQLLPLGRPFTPIEQGGPPQFDAQFTFPLDWFVFGKRKAAMAVAGIGVRLSEAEYFNLVRQRVLEASLAYFDVLEAQANERIARQNVETLERLEAMTRRAVQGGNRPIIDASRMSIEVLQARQRLIEAESRRANVQARVRALVGRVDSAPIDVAGDLPAMPTPPTLTVEDAMAIAQENRPDLAASRYRIAQAEADVELQHRKAYPGLSATAGYSRQFQQSIGYRDADTYMFGLEVGLPVFDRNQGNRSKAASVAAQAHHQLHLAQVDLRSEIETALNDYAAAVKSMQTIAQEQLKLAEQVRDAIIRAAEAGGQPVSDVMDAQRDFGNAYRSHVASRVNYLRAAARLNAVLGRKVAG